MTDRVHQLAQAAQVGDLLAERVDQYLEALQVFRSIPLLEGRSDEAERVRMCEENLRRAIGAYQSVRP